MKPLICVEEASGNWSIPNWMMLAKIPMDATAPIPTMAESTLERASM